MFESTILIPEREKTGLEIAVIGMAGRFPGADNVDEFWENIKNGVESISFFTTEELKPEGFSEEMLDDPHFVKAKGMLFDVEGFDSAFFGYTPTESELMDPQIRGFYECIWWALENAGYSPDRYRGKIGVVAGATNNRSWEVRAIMAGKTASLGGFASDHLIDRDFLSTRMAYRLNLKGPAITMKTACSSSMVAVDLASRLLLTGQCDIALAGGASVTHPLKWGYLYAEGMINSIDGHCRAFDARSRGVVFSDGIGAVVLKRLEEAVADRDNILAVILGSAINNDGSDKGSYSAPGVEGQAQVIKAAFQVAEVPPETIDYVETHGTGTTLGDPVEIEGLTLAFDTEKRQYCALGSVKSNVGHLDTTAGIAAFLKTVLALHHCCIPPSLHFENPNPAIDFANSPFYVNTVPREWPRRDHPRRAGVSSFGVGGTNVHAILEEAPPEEPTTGSRTSQMILLSAKNPKALDQLSLRLGEYLEKNPGSNLADVAYTLQVGHSAFKLRQMLVIPGREEAVSALTPQNDDAPFDAEKVVRSQAREQTHPVFMFSGQGSQYVNMGLELYRNEPDFAEEMDRCFEIFQSQMGFDIKDILYPLSDRSERSDQSDQSDSSDLSDINRTEWAQPLLFIFEYALARLLMKWGVRPQVMIGHSIGEYTAACLAGVFSLEDAIKLVALRGKLMQRMPEGSMLSVSLTEKEVVPLLEEELELGAVNAPDLCVVSGPGTAINRLAEQLKTKEVRVRLLHTSHAFHSRSMEPILDEFAAAFTGVKLHKPQIPYVSNLTGTWITVEDAADPRYWAQHMRKTVRFAEGLSGILSDESAVLVEVGPGRALSTFVRQHPAKKPGHPVLNLVRHPDEKIPDTAYLLDKLGRLWLNGQEIHWEAFYNRERRKRVPLPLYPFQRQSFWIPREVIYNLGGSAPDPRIELGKKKDLDHWFYIPSWKRSLLPGPGNAPEKKETDRPLNWLLFNDEVGIGAKLARSLEETGHRVITVVKGADFTRLEPNGYALDPGKDEDYMKLFNILEKDERLPHRVVHLWNVTPMETPGWGFSWNETKIQRNLDLGFYSLLNLAQVMGKKNIKEEVRITVFTNRAQEVTGDEVLSPEKAAVLGPVNVIPQEFPNIFCSAVDIVFPPGERERGGEERLVRHILEEINSKTPDAVVAYRNHYRLVQTYEAVTINQPHQEMPRLKERGVYLVTGGLGGIGMVLARYLAQQAKARLILTGRAAIPAREEWDQWLATHPGADPVSGKIRKVKELEALGAEVKVFAVDVTDYQGMKEVVGQVRQQWGTINGVIHAAGLPGGGIIQVKTREIADRVLLPKIKGTLVLETVLKGIPLDFILLCSSINSVVPMLGQVDYFSANAFLDAYAYYKTAVDGVNTISVNWDAWQEVGMAVEAAKETGGKTAAPAPQPLQPPYPLFQQYTRESREGGEVRKYTGRLSLEEHWPLNEHMTTDGKGLLPGTTYLEMARAAVENCTGPGPLEIRHANFMIPMMVSKNEEREVYLYLEKEEEHFRFRIESTIVTGVTGTGSTAGDFLQQHVLGEIWPMTPAEPRVHDIEAIKARCNLREVEVKKGKGDQPRPTKGQPQGLLVFGPRWKTSRRIWYGKNEAIVLLELPPDCGGDLVHYRLHPSLLDSSTGFLFGYVSGGKAYIPFFYKQLKMYRPLPARLYSYCRLLEEAGGIKEFLKFNVTIMDEQGKECVDIEEFTMLEVSEDIKGRIRQKEHISTPRVAVTETPAGELNPAQKRLKATGIRPEEGVEAFTRLLNVQLPQVVVSTTPLPLRLQVHQMLALGKLKEGETAPAPSGPRHTRPEISSTYAEPRNDLEKSIAEIFQENLGIAGIGINDDFFELGGDSLKAIAVTGKILKTTHSEVPLAEFFNNPTIKKLARFISGREVQDILEPIKPVEKKDYYVLSPAQERLYVLYRLAPQDTGYNLSRGMWLRSDIIREKVEEVIKKIIDRHECLRTSFEIIDGKPIQRIHEHVKFKLEYYDPAAQGSSKEEVVKGFVLPFHLEKAPLLRVGLIKVAEKKYILAIDFHHIITDVHSMLVIFSKDFNAFYTGEALSPLQIQYKDFSEWQNRNRYSPAVKKHEEFWLEEFKGGVPLLDLPLDHERPAVDSYQGDWVIFRLSAAETGAFRNILQGEEATLFMGLLTVYNILLFKLSGQGDIVVGTPTAGRTHPDLQPVMGMFVNMLVLRNFPHSEKTFSQFLKDVKERMLKVFSHQDYQFENLVEKLALERRPGRNPLFDVNLTLQSVAERSAQLTEEHGEFLDIETGASKFDLSLEIIEVGDFLHCKFEYKTQLFKRETIERFAAYYKEILAAVVKDKNIRLKDIRITHGLLEPTAKAPEMEFKF